MKKVLVVILAIAAILAGYTTFSWFRAKDAVRQYCGEVRTGMGLDAARGLAAQKGLRFFPSLQSNEQNRFVALVSSSGTMGRNVCTVEHDGVRVTTTRLDFHD